MLGASRPSLWGIAVAGGWAAITETGRKEAGEERGRKGTGEEEGREETGGRECPKDRQVDRSMGVDR